MLGFINLWWESNFFWINCFSKRQNRTPATLSNSEDSSKQQIKPDQEQGEGSHNRRSQQDSQAESSAPTDPRIDQLCIPSISSDGLRTPQTPQSIKSQIDQSIPHSSRQPRPVRQSPPLQFQESQQPSAFTAAFQLQLLQHLTPTFRFPRNKDPPSMASALNYSREWTRLAEVFDRLFFWLFLAAIVLSTLGLFHPILFDRKPTFYNKNWDEIDGKLCSAQSRVSRISQTHQPGEWLMDSNIPIEE